MKNKAANYTLIFLAVALLVAIIASFGIWELITYFAGSVSINWK